MVFTKEEDGWAFMESMFGNTNTKFRGEAFLFSICSRPLESSIKIGGCSSWIDCQLFEVECEVGVISPFSIAK